MNTQAKQMIEQVMQGQSARNVFIGAVDEITYKAPRSANDIEKALKAMKRSFDPTASKALANLVWGVAQQSDMPKIVAARSGDSYLRTLQIIAEDPQAAQELIRTMRAPLRRIGFRVKPGRSKNDSWFQIELVPVADPGKDWDAGAIQDMLPIFQWFSRQSNIGAVAKSAGRGVSIELNKPYAILKSGERVPGDWSKGGWTFDEASHWGWGDVKVAIDIPKFQKANPLIDPTPENLRKVANAVLGISKDFPQGIVADFKHRQTGNQYTAQGSWSQSRDD